MNLRRHFPSGLALSALSLLLTIPALDYGYHLEDYKYLRAYTLPEILRTFHAHWEPTGLETKGYRPLHSVQYALFHVLIGGDPRANHLLQTGLFLTGVLLFYVFALRSTGDLGTAFWIALVYPCLGSMAWHASQLTNRQHLLQIIFAVLTLLAFDRYLQRGGKAAGTAAFLNFLIALLLKEEVVLFPLVLTAYALIVRQRRAGNLVRPLLPFFLLTAVFIGARHSLLRGVHQKEPFPPPFPLTLSHLAREYTRSLSGTIVQAWGIRDPSNDFPAYEAGFVTVRDWVGLGALVGLLATGGALLLRRGGAREKKTVAFGLALLLIMTAMVAAWYRTQRIFLSSLGVALVVGTLAAGAMKALTERPRAPRLAALVALSCFLCYLGANLLGFFEIQWALRPEGFIALTWDRWAYEEYLPWMREEQLEIFTAKLRASGREAWAERLPAPRDAKPGLSFRKTSAAQGGRP